MQNIFENLWTSAKILFYTALFLSIEVIFVDRVINQFVTPKIEITSYTGVGSVITAFIAWYLLIVVIMYSFRKYAKLAMTLLNIVTVFWILTLFGHDMITTVMTAGSNESLIHFSLDLVMGYVYYLATRFAYRSFPTPREEEY